ncbi:UNKNOWN [Stylonychia lemnae]|uniref:Uncharacterized protein n=1 Tax=Stylonychia lemnae TaxID=5949 RepID=A0A078AQL1_STYLE|nr:UNKNOWN [Stylonychia lemnae]|eukprot:CDW84469.1 UNKNOWN [Stylonychia lemnae]
MIPPNYNPMGDCLQGYRGILCRDCSKGYSRDNSYQYCFINSRFDGEQSNSDQQRIFFFKLIIIAFFPFFLTFSCFLFWSILNKVRKNQFRIDTKATSSLVILLFLAHPSLVQYSFYDFKC